MKLMNNMIISVPLFISLLAICGCLEPPNPPPGNLPADFEFSYSSGATHLEWGAYYFNADSQGNASFLKKMGTTLWKEYNFKLSEQERDNLYQTFIEKNFSALNGEYQDQAVIDGGWDEISFTANGSEKTVSLINYSMDLPQFRDVEEKIKEALSAHVEDPFNFEDLKQECGGKKQLCEGKERIDCKEAGIECPEPYYIDCGEWGEYCFWEEEASSPTNPEYCNLLANRKECNEYCSNNYCSEELCDTLKYEAPACNSCTQGCCSLCTSLDSCSENEFCEVVWIHPSGEGWQFSSCENKNFCADQYEKCADLSLAYQGYSYHSAIEENPEKAAGYAQKSEELQEEYVSSCSTK